MGNAHFDRRNTVVQRTKADGVAFVNDRDKLPLAYLEGCSKVKPLKDKAGRRQPQNSGQPTGYPV
ncbi:hypothetical protein BC832DRAFT_549365 [Gaertneriomyces semiglobifer]|nr:hypothetical protein BC832DRAFT_549365 [Gaertneriomyces semiglobifer]